MYEEYECRNQEAGVKVQEYREPKARSTGPEDSKSCYFRHFRVRKYITLILNSQLTTLQRQDTKASLRVRYSLFNSIPQRVLTLITRRRALLMNQRNDLTKRDLSSAIYKDQEKKSMDIKVFCVGNELYGNPPHRLAEDYRNLSGVRELRSYCRSVPAEARMNSALVFIQEQVPALLDSIHQWILTCNSLAPTRARGLRSALEQSERSLRHVCLTRLKYFTSQQN